MHTAFDLYLTVIGWVNGSLTIYYHIPDRLYPYAYISPV